MSKLGKGLFICLRINSCSPGQFPILLIKRFILLFNGLLLCYSVCVYVCVGAHIVSFNLVCSNWSKGISLFLVFVFIVFVCVSFLTHCVPIQNVFKFENHSGIVIYQYFVATDEKCPPQGNVCGSVHSRTYKVIQQILLCMYQIKTF